VTSPAWKIPSRVEGHGTVKPFTGAFDHLGPVCRAGVRQRSQPPGSDKRLKSIAAAFAACEIRDGATLSFHHHLRNGDGVLNCVLDAAAQLGLRHLTVAASALFPVHAPLVGHIRSGVVSRVCASTIYGPLAEFVSRGGLAIPVLMYTHGGRARCIESGELHVDVAFVGAPAADRCGNINGVSGRAACGPLGYAVADVEHADWVVAVTDELVPYPACPIEISQDRVDYVVVVDSIGDPKQIVSGTTRVTTSPLGLKIAESAARVIEASGLLIDGFSFQTGAGGVSLAAAAALRQIMVGRGVRGSFAAGGITGSLVEMFDAGLFRCLFDVQAFDLNAVASYRKSEAHQGMSASLYANPHNRGCVAHQLDTVILGAAEVDLDFNVNVTSGTDGVILGGSGGHADTAAGAKLTVITTRLAAGTFPKIVDKVTTRTTPGETVDVVVTEAGVAVNPGRPELKDRFKAAGLNVMGIDALQAMAEKEAGGARPAPTISRDRIVAVVEYRDGTIIDVVGAVETASEKTWSENASPDRG
jgi:citrate lyase subunit alpha / citrate CoA-transferase